jgi:transposase
LSQTTLDTTEQSNETVKQAELPKSIDECHSLIKELMKLIVKKELDISSLKVHLQALLREKYGTKSEKLSPDQLSLFAEQLSELLGVQDSAESVSDEAMPAKPEETGSRDSGAPKSDGRKHFGGGRNALPPHLTRVPKDHFPEGGTAPVCSCGVIMTEFGVDITEQLDYKPANFKVIQHVTHKYSCKHCRSTVVQGRRPEQIHSGGQATEGLISQISVAKYADHSPLSRQEQTYAREGVPLSESTMGRWLEKSADSLKAITDRMLELMKTGTVLQADESPFDLLDMKRAAKKVRKGYVWALYGDAGHPYVYFNFESNRNADTAKEMLSGFDGLLITDGYGGYLWYQPDKSANCNVHARRYFEKALKYDKKKAGMVLALYTELYKIEESIRDKPAAEIMQTRQELSLPLMQRMHGLLTEWRPFVPPKTTLGVAINYALERWQKLTLFLSHSSLRPDTNLVENAIRSIAIGRRNWMKVGGEGGLQTASVHSTLVNTCKRLRINPYLYIRDVLIRLGQGEKNIDELLPDRWQQKYPLEDD